jgi:acyl carrier protein
MNKTTAEIESWFKQQIVAEAGIDVADVETDKPISSYSLDSLSMVSIAYELEGYLNTPVDPTIFSEFSTINDIIKWIQERQN